MYLYMLRVKTRHIPQNWKVCDIIIYTPESLVG